MPLWHGSSEEVCESIARSGFVYFGKKDLGKKTSGDPNSTDVGFFGSGIYFTNSARYSADIYSKGHLLLAWVSMREPFPVVGDPAQADMQVLKGGGAYKSYNAHYVPVYPEVMDPTCAMYYPCKPGEKPVCDEIVVFHKSQALPRFWVELTVSLPHLMQPDDVPQVVEDLIPHLLKMLQSDSVDGDKRLRNYLNGELAILMKMESDEYLEEHHEALFAQMQQLLDASGKVNRAVAKALTKSKAGSAGASGASGATGAAGAAAAAAPVLPPPKAYDEDLALAQALSASLTTGAAKPKPAAPVAAAKPVKPPLPEIAFGAAQWSKYFGDVGAEPPIPAGILASLKAECPFWPGKRVEETHLLTLIPATVDGKPFCLDLLEELIQHPNNGGHATKYDYYDDDVKAELGQQSPGQSYWALMTRDVLEGTRKKWYKDTCALLDKQRKGQPYEPPGVLDAATAILMEHVHSGAMLFGQEPWTYTLCREQVDGYRGAVGGFGAAGLYIRVSIFLYHVSGSFSFGGLAGFRK